MDFANMKSRIFDSLEIVDASNDKPLPGGANVKVGNRMFGLLAVMRVNYGREDKKFIPYVDILAGKRNYSTYSVLSLNDPQSNEEYESQVIENRVIHTNRFHMGLGAGFTYRLSNNLLLELGATYTVGAKGAALPLPDVYPYVVELWPEA